MSSHATNSFMCPKESHSWSLTLLCPGNSLLRASPSLRNNFLQTSSHMHRGGTLCWKGGYTCIPETVTIFAVLACVARQVQCHPGHPAMLWKERLSILAHLPDLNTTFLLADLAHLRQTTLVSTECHCGQWET